MTATISVKVEGPVGLDDPEELLEELGRATGLAWRREPAGRDGTLDGGFAEMMLQAVLSGAVGAAVQVATQRAIDTWRGRRLDPPSVTIVVLSPQAPQPLRPPQDPEASPYPEPSPYRQPSQHPEPSPYPELSQDPEPSQHPQPPQRFDGSDAPEGS